MKLRTILSAIYQNQSAKNIRVVVALALSILPLTSSSWAAPGLVLTPFVSGISSPVAFDFPKDGTNRIFIVDQSGKIRIIQNGALLPTPFLDLSGIIVTGGELGLLGLAFHPSYQRNGRFFVDYTRSVSGQIQTVIAEYHVSTSDPNRADTTGTEVLVVNQPFENHKGGQLAFGPDKYLYIAFGDGGSGGDPFGNGQNLGVLLGKLLRVDVDSTKPYAIPADNPFVGDSSARPEIWAYGMRNPWKYSFDRPTGRLFVGDVGQDNWEEVDIVTGGGNYGWNTMEGRHCYPSGSSCDKTGLKSPIAEYSHSEGYAVIGGYVYRGSSMPQLRGVYIFGDLNGKIWGLRRVSGSWRRVLLLDSGKSISGFGQDSAGELYLLDYGSSTVYLLQQP